MSAFLQKLKFAWTYFVRGEHRGLKRPDNDRWVQPPELEAQLCYGGLLVADLRRMFPHQGTWLSEYELRITSEQGELQQRLLAYIEFCEDFQRKIAEGQDHDFDAFDCFNPIPLCESWSVRLRNSALVPMEGRIWFADGEASWQHPETQPSTEAAAYEFWKENAANH